MGAQTHEKDADVVQIPTTAWRIPTAWATLPRVKRVIVLVAHGTVGNLDDLPAFLLRIRRGRPAPPELISEMRARYEAVGGSPHLEETIAQARALAEVTGIETRTAMRLWDPTVAEVTADLGSKDEVILVPLAPYSVAVYEQAARAELALRAGAPKLRCIGPWGQGEELIRAQVETIRQVLAPGTLEQTEVILTAHSLPQAVIDAGDRYAVEFESAAKKVADRLSCSTTIAYQSQGAGGGAWLGPTLKEAMTRARAQGKSGVLVAPIGFLSEHIETLYDLDIEARAQARELGIDFARVSTLRTHPGLVGTLGRAVLDLLKGQNR